jgi:1,4-dihydroxy-6-naphthoate synthase
MPPETELTVAFSPCPNDTFMFCDLALGRLAGRRWRVACHLHDVETLNRLALAGTYDVTKVSFAAYLQVRREYELLDVGAALGSGCGPLVVARDAAGGDVLLGRVAVPGEHTTAHLLLRLWAPRARNRLFVPYDHVMPMVADGSADCGVIIHEGRFTYANWNLRCLADLGEWWQGRTGLPTPLGGIVARRSLGRAAIDEFQELLRRSIQHSVAQPEACRDYVRRHAQEMDEQVLDRHVKTYVNEYSLGVGPRGREAVAVLERLARQAGVIE